MKPKCVTVGAVAIAATCAMAAFPAMAQVGGKSARLVVGFTPGGSSDMTARLAAPEMSKILGYSIVVENKPGASTNIAHEYVAKATADGMTMLLGTQTLTINPGLFGNLPYDPIRDFTAVSMLASTSNVLVVPTAMPVKDFKSFLALARSRPNQLNYASAGSGTPQHLAAELFKTRTNLKIQHIPFKGAAPALTALVGGEVETSLANIMSVQNYVKAGRLRALATTGATRSDLLPDVPTMKELGTNLETVIWMGLLVPSQTPKDVVAKISDAAMKAMRTADVKQRTLAAGAEPIGSSPEEFAKVIRTEVPQWQEVIRVSGAKAD